MQRCAFNLQFIHFTLTFTWSLQAVCSYMLTLHLHAITDTLHKTVQAFQSRSAAPAGWELPVLPWAWALHWVHLQAALHAALASCICASAAAHPAHCYTATASALCLVPATKTTLCPSGTASVQSTRAKTLQLHAKLTLQKCVLYMLTWTQHLKTKRANKQQHKWQCKCIANTYKYIHIHTNTYTY